MERVAKDRNELTVWLSAHQFLWLRAKFDWRWDEADTQGSSQAATYINPASFTGRDFERIIQAVLGLVEGRRYLETSASHDEGVDLVYHEVISTDWDFEATATTIVQCKLYCGTVPVTELRNFLGTMVARTATGLFFTTGSLTAQGKRFVPQANTSSMTNRFHVVMPPVLEQLFEICDEMSEMIVDHIGKPEKVLRAKIKALQGVARSKIYAARTSAPPAQGTLW